jgi:hypothetical protein
LNNQALFEDFIVYRFRKGDSNPCNFIKQYVLRHLNQSGNVISMSRPAIIETDFPTVEETAEVFGVPASRLRGLTTNTYRSATGVVKARSTSFTHKRAAKRAAKRSAKRK